MCCWTPPFEGGKATDGKLPTIGCFGLYDSAASDSNTCGGRPPTPYDPGLGGRMGGPLPYDDDGGPPYDDDDGGPPYDDDDGPPYDEDGP